MARGILKLLRYRVSREGLEVFPEKRGVKAWGSVCILNPDYIRIRWDGQRTLQTYASRFFERALH